MSTSKPSKEAIIIDVPTIKNFAAKFQYNFFVPEEGVEGTVGVPKKILERPSDTFDSSYIDQISSRVPRFVRFDFSPVVIPPVTKEVSDNHIRRNNLTRSDKKNLIKMNLDKVLHEDFFSGDSFTAVNLNDQSIDAKMFQVISGTAVILTDERRLAEAHSHKSLAKETNAMTSDQVTFQFLTKFLVQPTENNTFFFEKNGLRLKNDAVNRLKDVHIHAQVNNKFFHDIVNNAIVNPVSTFASDFASLHALSRVVQRNALDRSQTEMLHDEYKMVGKHISLERYSSAVSTTHSEAEVVGYIIDKIEVLPNGEHRVLDPIVIENPFVSTAVDMDVKYYGTYVYSIRTIASFKIPSIIEETNELVIATMLISSRPTRQFTVKCEELVPPPSPTDFNFHWNYETRKLEIIWTFPPNPQRDVKKFQIFRRKSINEPFQLLQMYDFDDSVIKAEPRETIAPSLIEVAESPTLLYIDHDFNKDSKFIYALASIDAHGLTSNYSEQFEVTFDRFKNKVMKRRISGSGAPKPYPNMFLNVETFVDLALDRGHKKVKVVFNPDHLSLYNNEGQNLRLLATTNDAAKYRISFINTDLHAEQTLDININDMRDFLDLEKKFGKTFK